MPILITDLAAIACLCSPSDAAIPRLSWPRRLGLMPRPPANHLAWSDLSCSAVSWELPHHSRTAHMALHCTALHCTMRQCTVYNCTKQHTAISCKKQHRTIHLFIARVQHWAKPVAEFLQVVSGPCSPCLSSCI